MITYAFAQFSLGLGSPSLLDLCEWAANESSLIKNSFSTSQYILFGDSGEKNPDFSVSPNFWYWPFFQYRVKEHNNPCAYICSVCAMILVGVVITVMQQTVLLAHKHVLSSEEVMFTLDLKLKSLAGNSIRSICLLWQECMFCVSIGM